MCQALRWPLPGTQEQDCPWMASGLLTAWEKPNPTVPKTKAAAILSRPFMHTELQQLVIQGLYALKTVHPFGSMHAVLHPTPLASYVSLPWLILQ